MGSKKAIYLLDIPQGIPIHQIHDAIHVHQYPIEML